MTLLGKCLTALILILSVGFAALALVSTASHKNWRDVVRRKWSAWFEGSD